MVDLLSTRRSTMAIFLFVVIAFPFGVVSEVVDRPTWDEDQWRTELENFRQKYYYDVKGGADGSIPRLLECALNWNASASNRFPQCPHHFRKMFLNEILLRKQYKGHNEDCNSRGTLEEDFVLNPPKREFELSFDFESYSHWQEKLINSRRQFCDPMKFLRCSAEHKCVCHFSSTWSPPNDVRPGIQDRYTCAFSHGSECFNGSTDGQRYFDPFKRVGVEYEFAVQVVGPPCRKAEDNCYVGGYLKEPKCKPRLSLIEFVAYYCDVSTFIILICIFVMPFVISLQGRPMREEFGRLLEEKYREMRQNLEAGDTGHLDV